MKKAQKAQKAQKPKIEESVYGVEGVKGVSGVSGLAQMSAEEANAAAMNALLSGKVVAQPKSKQSKKDTFKTPPELSNEMAVLVHGKRISKAIDKKVKIAADKLKDFFIKRWCENFSKTSTLPPTTVYTDGLLSIDFVQTKRIYLKQAAVEQLREMGVNVDAHTEQVGMFVNTGPIEAAGLMGDFISALTKVPGMTPDILQASIQPKFQAKDSMFFSMPQLAKESLGPRATEKQVVEQMVQIYKLLDPVSMLQHPTATCSFGDSAEHIINTPLGGDTEEE